MSMFVVAFWSQTLTTSPSTGGAPNSEVSVGPLEARLSTELRRIRHVTLQEYNAICSTTNQIDIKNRFVFIILRDLLDGQLAGEIFDSIDKRSMASLTRCNPAERTVYLLAAGMLVLVIVGMLVFEGLFLATHALPHRQALGISFAMWIVTDAIFVSSTTIFLVHVCIPMLISSEVTHAKFQLVQHMRRCRMKIGHSSTPPTKVTCYDDLTAAYLVISCRLVALLPTLTSLLTPLMTDCPALSFPVNHRLRQPQSRIQLVVYQICIRFLRLPVYMQDTVWGTLSAILWGVVILLHMWLYQTHPLLTTIPGLLAVIILHFIVQSSRHTHQLHERAELGVDTISSMPPGEDAMTSGNDSESMVTVVELLLGRADSWRRKRRVGTESAEKRDGRLRNFIRTRLLGKTERDKVTIDNEEHKKSNVPHDNVNGRNADGVCSSRQTEGGLVKGLRRISRFLVRSLSDMEDSSEEDPQTGGSAGHGAGEGGAGGVG